MSNNIYIKLRYRGRLKNPADVQQLIFETEDICRSNNWSCRIWDEDWSKPSTLASAFTGSAMHYDGHAPLKGISFSIGESESVWLTFTPDGTLQSLMTLADPTFTANDATFPWQRVKTGFEGGKAHLLLCKLFQYLAGKYFEVFEVNDESGYWQHGDEARLLALFNNLAHDHQLLEEELAAIEADGTLSPETKRDMAFRLLKDFGEKYRVK